MPEKAHDEVARDGIRGVGGWGNKSSGGGWDCSPKEEVETLFRSKDEIEARDTGSKKSDKKLEKVKHDYK